LLENTAKPAYTVKAGTVDRFSGKTNKVGRDETRLGKWWLTGYPTYGDRLPYLWGIGHPTYDP